jgi:hypothetical protein
MPAMVHPIACGLPLSRQVLPGEQIAGHRPHLVLFLTNHLKQQQLNGLKLALLAANLNGGHSECLHGLHQLKGLLCHGL